MKALSIEQRVGLIKDGFNDRDEGVKKVCEEMVMHWFSEACNAQTGNHYNITFQSLFYTVTNALLQTVMDPLYSWKDWMLIALRTPQCWF